MGSGITADCTNGFFGLLNAGSCYLLPVPLRIFNSFPFFRQPQPFLKKHHQPTNNESADQ